MSPTRRRNQQRTNLSSAVDLYQVPHVAKLLAAGVFASTPLTASTLTDNHPWISSSSSLCLSTRGEI